MKSESFVRPYITDYVEDYEGPMKNKQSEQGKLSTK